MTAVVVAEAPRGRIDVKRRRRYDDRDLLTRVSKVPRLRLCGRRPVSVNNPVALVSGARGSSYSGVSYCGSIWSCPVCSAMIRQRRVEEIEQGAGAFLAAGGGGVFVTFTIPHKYDDRLASMLKVVTPGWSKIVMLRAVRDALARNGFVGAIKAVESTFGENGWHPHLHLLLLFHSPLSPDSFADLAGVLEAAWLRYAARNGFGSEHASEYGVRVQPVEGRSDGLSKYLAKIQEHDGFARSPALELARADLKTGRKRGRTPFEILHAWGLARKREDMTETIRLAAIWQEWEAETRGKRAIVWSRGLKAALGVDEVSDEQAVEETVNEGATVRLTMDKHQWSAVHRAGARGLLLCTYDKLGAALAMAMVDALLAQDRDEFVAPWDDDG